MNQNFTGSNQQIPEGLAYGNMMRDAQLNHGLGGPQQTMSAEFMNRAAGYGPGLASGQIGSARDKGEIESQIDALDNQLKSLQIIASQISDKFAPILSGANNNTGNLSSSPPLHTLLGGRLYTMNAQAAILRESLQDIIDRCKL